MIIIKQTELEVKELQYPLDYLRKIQPNFQALILILYKLSKIHIEKSDFWLMTYFYISVKEARCK